MKDLVILVPDKNTQFVEFRPHPGRDGGARTTGVDVLARERTRFRHALLMFDLEGSGSASTDSAESLQAALDARLAQIWGEDARSIVIAPEVDVWLWGADSVLREALEWKEPQAVRAWLQDHGHVLNSQDKPLRPKEAIEALVRAQNMPRSSALYLKITQRISLRRCSDPAFTRLRSVLQQWFASGQ